MSTPGSIGPGNPVPDGHAQRKGDRRHVLLGVLFWVIFASGLLVQVLAPRLKIENNAFAVPSSLVSQGAEIRIAEIIGKQRRMQWLSVALTVTGALGLAFYYRRRLLAQARSP
jgi:hypothetical protein